jgi:hypothetical protein
MTLSNVREYRRRVSDFFSKHPSAWFFAGAAVIAFVVSVNAFPAGYRFVSAHGAQPFVGDRYDALVSETDGRGVLWFGLFLVFEKLGLSDDLGLSAYLFLFLFGAYASFRWFLRAMFPDSHRAEATLLSLSYALNVFTLQLVFSGRFIAPAQTLYVFLPALAGALLAFFRSPSMRSGGMFLLLFFPATAAFTDPAAFIPAVVFFVALSVIAFVSGIARIGRKTVVAISVLGAFVLALSAYFLPSVATVLQSGTGTVIPFGDPGLAPDAATSITDALRMLPSPNGLARFPEWFPYERFEAAYPFFMSLTVLPAFLVLWALSARKPDGDRKRLFVIGFSLFVLFVSLLSGVFRAPLVGSFSMTAVPFLLFWTVSTLRVSGRYRVAFLATLVLTLMSPLPFFAGKIHRFVSPVFHDDRREDSYTGARVSDLVRIPGEYASLAREFDDSEHPVKIARLPFSSDDGEYGTEYLPEARWHGADVLAPMFDATLISANRPYFGNWLYAKTFAESETDPAWILPLFRASNIGYVLFQKDAAEDAREVVEEKLDYLERWGDLLRERETDAFVLYRVSGAVMPRVSVSDESFPLSELPSGNLSALSVSEEPEFRAPDVVSEGRGMAVSVGKKDSGRFLTLADPYDVSYGAVIVGPDGAETPLWHIRTNGFLNGWKLPKISGDATVRIVYYPERFIGVGRTVSFVAFLCVIIALSAYTPYERRKEQR